MSLEAKIELLTAAVTELTRAIGAMSTVGFADHREALGMVNPVSASLEDIKSEVTSHTRQGGPSVAPQDDPTLKEAPNEPQASTEESPEPSVQTGDLSSPELTYKDHVKPATLKLSQQKGRDVAIAVLARFGVKGAQDLDESQWAGYVAHVDKVLAGGEV